MATSFLKYGDPEFDEFLDLFSSLGENISFEVIPPQKHVGLINELYLEELARGETYQYQPLFVIPSLELVDILCTNLKIAISDNQMLNEQSLRCTQAQRDAYESTLVDLMPTYAENALQILCDTNRAELNHLTQVYVEHLKETGKFDASVTYQPWSNDIMCGGFKSDYFLSCVPPHETGSATLLLVRCPYYYMPHKGDLLAVFPFGNVSHRPRLEFLRRVSIEWFELYNVFPAVLGHDSLEFYNPVDIDDDSAKYVAKTMCMLAPHMFESGMISHAGQLAASVAQSRVWSLLWS